MEDQVFASRKDVRRNARFPARWNPWFAGILAAAGCAALAAGADSPPSRIEKLLKPQEYTALVRNDDTLVTTALSKSPDPPFLMTYQAAAAITTEAPVSTTRRILTNYEVYAKLIPFIDRVQLLDDPSQATLEGGIFGWKMTSLIQFQDKDPGWVHFVITRGSFAGMQGDFYFEQKPGRQDASLVYFHVQHTAEKFPPRFIMEFGAGIILSLTASRMQDYVKEVSKERFYVGPRELPSGGFVNRKRRGPEDEPSDQ